jgi:hypothetical protein
MRKLEALVAELHGYDYYRKEEACESGDAGF